MPAAGTTTIGQPDSPSRNRRLGNRAAVGSLGISLAAHVLLIASGMQGRPTALARVPVAGAVEPSWLVHQAAPVAPEQPAEPPVEAEPTLAPDLVTEPAEPESSVFEPAIEPLQPEPSLRNDRRLAQVARTSLRPPPATPSREPIPEATPAPTPAAAQVARPLVPVVIQGQNPAPDYPPFAKRRGIQGTVLVRIEVDASGLATGCAVVLSSGSTSLDLAALAAARKWRFLHGPGAVEVPFVFQIRG